ncbi:MAG: tRNA-(ms[2]io[6]A)-hydroxylase [Woeseia sp.]|nr:tRNA-(ms[2]io[6]A)-hydroxylase [Woeseia sp.]
MTASVPAAVSDFLGMPTPDDWLDKAAVHLRELLLDHANCELKAASSALGIIYRYPQRDELVWRMSRLAREELRHFEQVRQLMRERGIVFQRLTASRYASTLHEAVRREEPARLLDTLIVGALIEARSCERFAALIPLLPEDVARFYRGLLASEARHFEQYLNFAKAECGVSEQALAARVAELRRLENQIISTPDSEFRFHSGLPAAA